MKTLQSKLRLFLISISVIGMATFFLGSVGYADNAPLSWEDGYYYYNDFGDHRSSSFNYGNDGSGNKWASNNTTKWQALGTNAGMGNWGVSWSTDGGKSFGHGDIYVGEAVKFKFDMYSYDDGDHLANVLKSWIDWGVGNTGPSFDSVLYSAYKLVEDTIDQTYKTFIFDTSLPDDDSYLGTAYLRARVTCTESIRSVHGVNGDDVSQYANAFSAYKDYNQGEIEDWKFNVIRRPGGGDPVPEPATFALFGMGLIGLARLGRKKA